MLESAGGRLKEQTFSPVAADGKRYRSRMAPFMPWCASLVAVLSESRSRVEGVPSRATRWVPGRDMPYLRPRPRSDVGRSCRCAWPSFAGAATDRPTVLLACRPRPAGKFAEQCRISGGSGRTTNAGGQLRPRKEVPGERAEKW